LSEAELLAAMLLLDTCSAKKNSWGPKKNSVSKKNFWGQQKKFSVSKKNFGASKKNFLSPKKFLGPAKKISVSKKKFWGQQKKFSVSKKIFGANKKIFCLRLGEAELLAAMLLLDTCLTKKNFLRPIIFSVSAWEKTRPFDCRKQTGRCEQIGRGSRGG
jgi:hypothetical protein